MNEHDIMDLAEALQVFNLDELCQRRLLDAEFVVQCVELGIVDIHHAQPRSAWRFPVAAVLRMERAQRLQRDLGVQTDDLALVLELLDEVETLRAEVTALRRRLQHWEHLS